VRDWGDGGGWRRDDCVDEPEVEEFARFLGSLPRPRVDIDPTFQATLRRRVMEEARRLEGTPAPWYRRLLPGRPPGWPRLGRQIASLPILNRPAVAWPMMGAVAGLMLMVLAVAALNIHQLGRAVPVRSPVDNAHAVALVKPITLTFDQPMDQRVTEEAVSIEPATAVVYRWTSPTTLELVPQGSGLAPSTHYRVTVQPSARTAGKRALNQPVTFSFDTQGPTPTPAQTAKPTASPSPATSPSPSPSPSASPSASPSPSPRPSPSMSPSPKTSPRPSPGTSPSPTEAPDSGTN
jgi:hypothetical protein